LGWLLGHRCRTAGCFTQGETIDEVRKNLIDAIECYLEDSTPEKHDPLAATLVVRVG
jgi:predicted RNase H-like HicB family nuclease